MTDVTSPPADAAIRCADLVRIFTADGVEVQALQGLTLRVDPGELVAIVGASGSGKSTLLGILSGLDKPTAGSVSVAGRDLLALGNRERVHYRRHTVGFVWQQTSRNLLPYLTARENLALAMSVARTGDRARRAAELLELLEVSHCAERRPTEMSGGEQQRVAIAVALANEPRVLLADEPTGELDEATSVEVLEAMRGVNRELGVTTLIVTHDPAVSEHVARTVQIRDGRTATEVLRRTGVNEHGDEHVVAEEFAVLDRVGRLQLPQEYLSTLGMRDRVRLALEQDHVGVWPHDDTREAVGDDR
ncbi:ABC transporter ATP-binding protein [Leifsonia sp. ku-ls]|jgi:ABC-type lipoprotein export system ATPase subunit|nr:ABC transporter ATP-binding protein [Leifsonia sp. ku-ls]